MPNLTHYDTEIYLPFSILRYRGWTTSSVKKLLKSHDYIIQAKNRVIPLYDRERVLKHEMSNEWQIMFNKNRKRNINKLMKMAIKYEKQRERAVAHINKMKINIPSLTKTQLYAASIQHFNKRNVNKITPHTLPNIQFINRITVNYLRHCCTPYDFYMKSMKLISNNDELYCKLKTRILKEIVETYPFLQKACKKQY